MGWEDRNDPVDSFCGIQCVQCGEHQVTGFGRGNGGFNRFVVTHFTDEDDIGILT